MTTLKDRLKEARSEAGLSQGALAKLAKCGQTTIASIENGRNKGSTVITQLSTALNVNPVWLAEGRPPKRATSIDSEKTNELIDLTTHPDLLSVPRVKFKLSAGVSGYSVEPENGNGKPVFFRKDWFDLHNYRPEKLLAIRVSGSSMEPSLWDDDLVVINTDDTAPHDGDVFALNYEGELVIKRMRRDAGEWWACSDNADQRRFAPKRCTEDVQIIGRVVYKQSERI